MRITLRLLPFLLLLTPALGQNTPKEFKDLRLKLQDEVHALHEDYSDAEYERLKRQIKGALGRLGAVHARYEKHPTKFEGVWRVEGNRFLNRGSSVVEEKAAGELKITSYTHSAKVDGAKAPKPPAEGDQLVLSGQAGQNVTVVFSGKETTGKKIASTLNSQLTSANIPLTASYVYRRLRIRSLVTGPESRLVVGKASSPGALAALALTPGERRGGVSIKTEGRVTVPAGSSWRMRGELTQGGTVRLLGKSTATSGKGSAELSLQGKALQLKFESDRKTSSGQPRSEGVLTATSAIKLRRRKLEAELYHYQVLDMALRYPRVADPATRPGRLALSKVAVRFAPRVEFDKGGVEGWVVGLIDKAQTSIDLGVFELQLPRVADALIRAHRDRDVAVRIVHDSDEEHEPEIMELQAYQDSLSPAQEKKAAFLRQNDADRRSLMHNKFMVLDGRWVWTGSTNMTPTAMREQDNNALLFDSPALAKVYLTEFEEMLAGQFGTTSPANTRWSDWQDDTSVKEDWLSVGPDTSVQIYFAPEDNAMDRLVEIVRGAKKSIKFLAFSYTSDELFAAMRDGLKQNPPIQVEGVFESLRPTTCQAPALFKAGAKVRYDINPWKLHHKVIVVDGEIVCTGSFNFSENADKVNDENLVVVRSEKIARAFLQEFDAIMQGTSADDPNLTGEESAGAGLNGAVGPLSDKD